MYVPSHIPLRITQPPRIIFGVDLNMPHRSFVQDTCQNRLQTDYYTTWKMKKKILSSSNETK